MLITDLTGQTELLTDYKNLGIKRRVNGEYSLSFLLLATERNAHSYPLVQEESIIEYELQEYRIKKVDERAVGDRAVKNIYAEHVFFDLIDEFQYGFLQNTRTIDEVMTFITEGTGFTYSIPDSFSSAVFENFGNDNCLSLLQKALNVFGAEVEINRRHLTIRRQIGRKTDVQFRYKHNLKTIEKNVDTSNLSTYIRGYGKQNEDGTYAAQAEYTSPLASVYGIRHAAPIYDDRFTDNESLFEYIQTKIQDTPNISFKITLVELQKAGYNYDVAGLGDEVFVIYEPLNIDITARILEYEEFPEDPRSSTVTLANFSPSVTDILADFGKTKQNVDAILNGTKKLPYNALDDSVKRATNALNNSLTELEYPKGLGIVARDPENSNRFVVFRSNGIGITTDGGKTFKEAITADGFVLSAGVVGYLEANNIKLGPGTLFEPGYDPSEKETPDGAQQKADAALNAAKADAQTKANAAQAAAQSYAESQAAYAQTQAEVYADGIVSSEEQARIQQAADNLAEAKRHADLAAQAAEDAAVNLDAALRDDLRLSSSLPQTIYLSADGISAYTENPDGTTNFNKFARFDSRGLYIKDGAILIEGGLPDSEIQSAADWNEAKETAENSVQLNTGYSSTYITQEGILVEDANGQTTVKLGEYEEGKYGLQIKSSKGDVVLDEDGIMQTWQEGEEDNADAEHPIVLDLYIPEPTIFIKKAILRFRIKKFRSYSTPISYSGRTNLSMSNVDFISYYGGGGTIIDGGHDHGFLTEIDDYYGIYEGGSTSSVGIKINGVDRTALLGGPFSASQDNLNIAPYITKGWNTIELTSTQLVRLSGKIFIQCLMGTS
jgi:phage minor structural protein